MPRFSRSPADSLSFFESLEADKVSYEERKPSIASTVTDRESPPTPAPRAVRSNQVVYTTVGGRQASRVHHALTTQIPTRLNAPINSVYQGTFSLEGKEPLAIRWSVVAKAVGKNYRAKTDNRVLSLW